MEECNGDRPCWEDLIPDLLGLIFRKLSLEEILTVVPPVCKSWSQVVSGPYCWQDIDLHEWSQELSNPEKFTRMVHMLIARSDDSFRRISVTGLPNDSLFSFIADHARSLQTMELPRSDISDQIVEDVAHKLSNVTFLDVSSCTNIGARALEAFGKNCKSLVGLRRFMNPIYVDGNVCQDDEARGIACSMPKLRHLVIGYMLITTKAAVDIASQCHDLKFLDLRACWDVDGNLLQEKYPGLKILGPHVGGFYENNFWEDFSDFSDDESIYSWEEFMEDDYFFIWSDDEAIWDDDHFLDGLEIGFYGNGFGEGFAGFDWPESP